MFQHERGLRWETTPADIMIYEDATNEVTLCRYVTGGQSCLEWAINLHSACCGVSSRCLCSLTHPLRSGSTDLGYYTSTPPSHIHQEHLRDDNTGRIGRQTPATKTTRDTCGLIWTGGGWLIRLLFLGRFDMRLNVCKCLNSFVCSRTRSMLLSSELFSTV